MGRIILLILLSSIVFSIWISLPTFIFIVNGGQLAASGQVGDTFGVVNSLFAGLALLGVVYTIIVQQSDARDRNNQFLSQQALATEELRQSRLATRLETTRTLIDQRRTLLQELNPNLTTIPTSISRLNDLRHKVIEQGEFSDKTKAAETVDLIDELIELDKEWLSLKDEIASR